MKQHYIPKCYLKGFLDAEQKIWKLQLNTNFHAKPKAFTTTQVGYETDFYRLEGLWEQGRSVSDPNIIENVINAHYERKLESQISSLSTFVNIPSLPERIAFAETIVHLKRRNGYFRESVYSLENLSEIRKTFFTALQEVDKETLEAIAHLEGISSEEVIEVASKLLDDVSNSDHFLKEMHNLSLLKRTNSDDMLSRIVNYIATADWIILKAPSLAPFITSDNPGFLIDRNGAIKSMGFEGTFRFYLPLSAQRVLLISKTAKQYTSVVDIKDVNASLVQQINIGTVRTAHKLLFASSKRALDTTQLKTTATQGL